MKNRILAALQTAHEQHEILDRGALVELLQKGAEDLLSAGEQITRLRAMLRRLEWCVKSDGGRWRECPECHVNKGLGHAPNCELAKLLKEE